MKLIRSIFLVFLVCISSGFSVAIAEAATENNFTGFWKEACSDAFGLQIKPVNEKIYSVSFCGSGGCFEPGTWTPNTTIESDPNYRIINKDTLEIKSKAGKKWFRYQRCTSETNPKLDYATMKEQEAKSTSKIKFIEMYKGLPDYDKETPFTNTDQKQHTKLKKALSDIVPSVKQCNAGSVLIWKAPKYAGDTSGEDWRSELWTNICEQNKLKNIKKLVVNLAPSLIIDNLTAWVTDLDGDNDPDLIVGYLDISKDELKYPYLSFWRLKFVKGKYIAYYAGPFLNGTFHGTRNFGEKPGRKVIFVKHNSCIECEPIVYLTAIDFNAGNDARPYEFTYSEKHDVFNPTIEYELPGMGHTVEAKVETRVPPFTYIGPHLLQFFKMMEGQNEWWVFTCKDYKCDYQLYKDELPARFKKLWEKANPL